MIPAIPTEPRPMDRIEDAIVWRRMVRDHAINLLMRAARKDCDAKTTVYIMHQLADLIEAEAGSRNQPQ